MLQHCIAAGHGRYGLSFSYVEGCGVSRRAECHVNLAGVNRNRVMCM